MECNIWAWAITDARSRFVEEMSSAGQWTARRPVNRGTVFKLDHWVWLVLLALCAGFVGCQGGDTGGDAGGDAAQQNETAGSGEKNAESSGGKRQVQVAFVTNQIANFWNIAKAGCEDAEAELSTDALEVTVRVRFPDPATATRQKQDVEDLLAAGVQAIAISPLSADDQVPLLNQWAEKVPLITHDSDSPDSNRLVYIGMDNYAAGRMAGEMVKQALPNGGKVALFIGRLEQDNSKLRRQGVIDVLMGVAERGESFSPVDEVIKNDKFEIVGTYLDQGSSDVALRKAEDALSAYNDLAAMVGLFEYNPPEIIKAVEKRGKLNEVAIIGFDENDATLTGIKEGYVTGTVVQNPYQYGFQSVRVLTEILTGSEGVIPESKYIDIPPRAVTKDNVDEYWDELRSLLAR